MTLLLDHDIAAVARSVNRSDGVSYRSLSGEDQRQLAATAGVSQREVQLAALARGVVPEIYAKNQTSLGCEEQMRLLCAHVAIVGLGGLGGTVCEILARVGIGRLTLIDGDRFVESNLNRQLLSDISVLGRLKAEVAAARVAQVNPAVEARGVTFFLSEDNADECFSGVDIVVDCLDSIATRLLLEQLCEASAVPLVSAAVGGTAGQALVVYPGEKSLARLYQGKEAKTAGAEAVMGTLPFAVVALAAVECAETVAIAAGRPAALRNRLLLVDTAGHESVLTDI